MTFEAGHAFLRGINPDFAAHGGQGLRFEILGTEAGVGPEGEFLNSSGGADAGASVLIEERAGEHSEEFEHDAEVGVFALLAVLLQTGVGGKGVEPFLFFLSVEGAERGVVNGEQVGYIAVPGFDDVFDRGDAGAGFAQQEAHGVGLVLRDFYFCFQGTRDQRLSLRAGKLSRSGG